jgi:hypothetical protein
MKAELRLRGANSISKFHHHNINGVTGRRLVSSIYSRDIYGIERPNIMRNKILAYKAGKA